ncbi:MAG TPA: c-type cytochrome biogenesis protein CcmI [Usitatibacteraceae bacterium]|nr:c-type cytochrome biogenesis protein CcmI [Usitatibacteraceae bacterium]
MSGFLAVAAVMVLVAMAFVVVPLWRGKARQGARVADSNVAVFRAQREEIEREFAQGQIDAAERDAALAELSSRVVEEVEPGAPDRVSASGGERSWPLVIGAAALVPAAAAVLYVALQKAPSPHGDAMAQMGAQQMEAEDSPQISDASMVAMVDALAKKMEANPGDPKGWILLGRSQAALGRAAESQKAFERADKLQPNDAQILADWADSSAMAQKGNFDGKPRELIARALKADPNHLKALALAASMEMKGSDPKASLKYWEKLLALVPKESADHQQVQAIIAEVKAGRTNFAAAAQPAAPAPPPHPPMGAAPAANAGQAMPPHPPMGVPAPANAKTAAPATPAAAGPGKKVTGQVALSPALAAKLGGGETLYVLARAKEGPRLPLAVMRVPAPKADGFPARFELSDAMAMSPGMNLSAFAEVVIEARVSKTGNATRQSGDLFGISGTVKPAADGVRIVIDQIAP